MERARDNTEKRGRVTKSHLEARAKIMETCAKIMATCARTQILCAIFLGSSAPITCRQSLVYLFNFRSLRHAFKGNSR